MWTAWIYWWFFLISWREEVRQKLRDEWCVGWWNWTISTAERGVDIEYFKKWKSLRICCIVWWFGGGVVMFEVWEGVWHWKRVVWSYQGYCLWCWKSMLTWLRRVIFFHMSINICDRPTYAPSAQMWQKPAPRLGRSLLAASAPLWTKGLNGSSFFMEHGSRGWREDCGCISPGGHLLMSKVEKEKEAGDADWGRWNQFSSQSKRL